jgi:hypothetical protein
MTNTLNQKSKEGNIESEILSGSALESNDEVRFIQSVKRNNHNYSYPLYQKKLNLFEYEFLKTYLYALYEGTLTEENISVAEFAALASNANPVIIAPRIASTNERGLSIIENEVVYVHLEFEGNKYQVTVYIQLFHSNGNPVIRHNLSVLGTGPDSVKTNVLAIYLINQSIKNSYYKNNLLSVKLDDFGNLNISELKIDEFKNESLDKIYVPDQIKSELKRFKECAENFEQIGYGLRYLLCGSPGTGKTKSVRSLINLLYGKVTIIVTTGETDFKALFDFARLLSPAVICMDDLDLITGSRETGYFLNTLGNFLQELDGFEKNNIFLLATTNDKSLIDKAASRPGRFDMILDFGKIHKANYIDLISSATNNGLIIELFDEELLNRLKKKNVTGAFIVNLIKQLEIKYKLEGECDLRKYLYDLIDLSHRGFYNKSEEKEFGFIMNGG